MDDDGDKHLVHCIQHCLVRAMRRVSRLVAVGDEAFGCSNPHSADKEESARDLSLRYEDLRLWKMDFKGAYTLLSFRAEHVELFGMLLTDDLVYLQLAGIFDWSGTPAAWSRVRSHGNVN